MDVLLYALLAIVGVGAAGFALVPSLIGSNSRADKRIKALQGDIQANRREAETGRTRDLRRKQISDTLKVQNEALGKARKATLQDQATGAGMKIKARDWVRNQIIIGAVFFVICLVLGVPALDLGGIPIPLASLVLRCCWLSAAEILDEPAPQEA